MNSPSRLPAKRPAAGAPTDEFLLQVVNSVQSLPLVKSLLELHQASLHLESAVGAGTTASARFPAQRTIHR